MKYAVVVNSNGTFEIKSEWTDDLPGARIDFWDKCKIYENAQDVKHATVAIMDENYDIVEGKREFITHEVVPNE